MAPEFFTSSSSHGRAADIYSLGICLWEALGGDIPKVTSKEKTDGRERDAAIGNSATARVAPLRPPNLEACDFMSSEARELLRKVGTLSGCAFCSRKGFLGERAALLLRCAVSALDQFCALSDVFV